jgi:hypothetical protein
VKKIEKMTATEFRRYVKTLPKAEAEQARRARRAFTRGRPGSHRYALSHPSSPYAHGTAVSRLKTRSSASRANTPIVSLSG